MNAKLKERLKHLILSIEKGKGLSGGIKGEGRRKSRGSNRYVNDYYDYGQDYDKDAYGEHYDEDHYGGRKSKDHKRKSIRSKSIMGNKRLAYSPKASENRTQGGKRVSVNPKLLYGIDVGPKYKSSNGGKRKSKSIKKKGGVSTGGKKKGGVSTGGANPYVQYVKKFAKAKGISYKDAMVKAKASYRKQ